MRLPKPLEHLANAKHGRYILSGTAVFSYRADEWLARITGGKSVAYTITRKPGRAGCYLTAAWAASPDASSTGPEPDTALRGDRRSSVWISTTGTSRCGASTPTATLSVDLERIDVESRRQSSRRDAQVRHAITRLIRYTQRHGIDTIAVEDLNFADARTMGRETMGRGQRGKRFRKTVAGIPTAVFRNRLPPKPTTTESACTRSTPPTPALGATSTGAPPMRTSPDTRQPPS